MQSVTLDLRIDNKFPLFIDKNVAYQLAFSDINILDTEYTLTFEHKTYSVSNGGLVLETESKSIIWDILADDFEKGNHNGVLVSQSRQSGIYLKINIQVKCYENND